MGLLLGWAALTARAQSSFNGFTYTISSGSVTIQGYTGAGGAVTIPAAISGDPVTVIYDAAFAQITSITSISIPSTVTSIGNETFYGCTGLTSITLPSAVTSIGAYAFDGCSSLTTVTIDGNLSNIGSEAFQSCSSLTSVIFLGNAPPFASDYTVFQGDTNATITYFSGTGWGSTFDGIPATQFPFTYTNTAGAITITGYTGSGGAVTIPATVSGAPVTSIAASALAGSGITTITLPASITSIGADAFQSCTSLTNLSFQGNAPTVGANAFQGDSGASITYLPGTTGWTNPFAGLPAAPSAFTYTVSGGLVTITGYTGAGGAVTVPSTIAGDPVVAIGANAFASHSSITSVTIPNSVTSIGASAFASDANLVSITFLGNAPTVSSTAFQGDSSASITYFSGTTGWTTPFAGLTASQLAFAYSVSGGAATITGYTGTGGAATIPSVIAGNPVTTIGVNAFDNTSTLTSVTIPSSVTSIGSGAFAYCTGLTSITIGGSVTSIGDEAFQDCTGLTSVVIPSSVTAIGNEVFQSCSGLTSVTIPNSVTSIGAEAFQYCTGLSGITIPASVTSIGFGSFANCSGLTSLAIPNSVTTIGAEAFQYCTRLTSVTIPASVTSIGVDAFANTGLTSITFLGNAPAVDSTAFQGDTGATITYSPGTTGWTNPFAGLPASAAATPLTYVRLVNLSARAFVNTGSNILIAGFSIGGSGGKQLLLRGVGPRLGLDPFDIAGALANAQLGLYDGGAAPEPAPELIASDNGWANNTVAGNSPVAAVVTDTTAAIMSSLGAFAYVNGSLDSAVDATLPTGGYSSEISGLGSNPTGVALAEIYDADPGFPTARLVNISARASIGTGSNILIAGFGIAGNTSETVLIRGIGPRLGLSPFFLAGVLAAPQLTLYDGNTPSEVIAANSGWSTTPTTGPSIVAAVVQAASAAVMSSVGAFALTTGSNDTAMLVTLPPGNYTAQLSGVGGTTGIGLIEVYEVQ